MKTSSNVHGIRFLILAMLVFSVQDIAVKYIGGDYSIIEIVMFRSIVALPATLVLFRLEGGRGIPITKQSKLEYGRGILLVLSYTTNFMGLVSLPLADVAAIRFSSPIIITVLSVFLLHEKVKVYKWIAVIVGFIGVLFIVKPGTQAFNIGYIYSLLSVSFYVFAVMITRQLKETDSSATMAYYSSIVYLIAAFILAPLPVLVGEMPDAQAGIAFLFRAWTMPTLVDLIIMAGLGFVWATGMYFISRAYSLALASVAAPFEYLALPISILWGFLFWREVPTIATLLGALLTICSGLYILYRERQPQPEI